MPSLFQTVRDTKDGRVNRKKAIKRTMKTDDKEVQLSRRKRLMASTEIQSDDEDSIGHQSASEASENEYDNVDERTYREAKQLLSKLEEEKKEDEDLGDLLREDAAQRAGTLKIELADKAELRDEEEINYKAHRFTPLCIAISPCSKYVISCGKESSIVKYSLIEKKVVGVIKRTKKNDTEQHAHYGHIFAVAISSDGRFIASGGFDNVLKIWNFETLAHVHDFKGHRAPITALCFQLKTNCLFSASRDRSVKLWDLDQMGMVDTMFGHQDSVQSLSALQKQRVLTAGAQDRTCRLWKVEDESQLVFTGPQGCITMDCVAMLNDDHFVSGSSSGTLCLWSLWKKKPVAVRQNIHGLRDSGEARWVVSIAAVPYSDLVATGSDDGLFKLWKISPDYKRILQVYEYNVDGFINSICFSPDGKLVGIAAGQEHREGRWWVNKEARNQVVVLPIHYGEEDESSKSAEDRQRKEFDLGSDDDSDDDKHEEDDGSAESD